MELDFDEYVEHLQLMRKKAEFFQQKLKAVHVQYKKDFWRNGWIDEIESDVLMLNDFREGSVPVFFLEIDDITEFHPEGEKNEGK